MPLLDGQWSFRGLIFGDSTDYRIDHIDGFDGFDARSSDSELPRGDGSLRGWDFTGPRTISLELALIELEDLDGSTYERLWSDVREAFRPSRSTDYDLAFKRPGRDEQVIRCRPIQLVRGEQFSSYSRVGHPPIVLRATDPRIYSAAVKSGNIPVYGASGGGIDLPVVQMPVDFTGGFQTEFGAENTGTADAYPVVRFHGPVTGTCTGVTLTNTTTDQVMTINTDIVTGQILTADMEAAVTGVNRLVISLDGSTRYGSWALPRTPFAIAPGSNTLRFTVAGSSTDVVCLISYRDTSLS